MFLKSNLLLKKINFNKKNFYYYFNIIYKFRNDKDYLKRNNIKKVIREKSFEWLKKNNNHRIFFLIKYNNQTAGIFNFNKLKPTFSQVILRKFRDKKIGKQSAILLLKELRKIGFNNLVTFASKNNPASFKIHKSISIKHSLHEPKNKIYKFYINTQKKFINS